MKKTRKRLEPFFRKQMETPLMQEIMSFLEGAPCAGCGRELLYPYRVGLWVTETKRTVPYSLCERCGARAEEQDKELVIEIERRVGNWLAGNFN